MCNTVSVRVYHGRMWHTLQYVVLFQSTLYRYTRPVSPHGVNSGTYRCPFQILATLLVCDVSLNLQCRCNLLFASSCLIAWAHPTMRIPLPDPTHVPFPLSRERRFSTLGFRNTRGAGAADGDEKQRPWRSVRWRFVTGRGAWFAERLDKGFSVSAVMVLDQIMKY